MTEAARRASRRPWVPFAALSASYFAHIGFFNPYLSLWLKELGLTVWVIGLLVSLQSFTRLFAPYAWGWLSDHTGERVKLLRWSAGVALLCSLGLGWQGGLAWLAVVLLLMFTHTSSMMPMSEAAMAHLVSRGGEFDTRRYGRIRLWGSIGFLITVFFAGAWFEGHGMQHFPAWTWVTLLAVNASVWWMPNLRESVQADGAHPPVWPVLRQPHNLWFFAALFFHVLSHISIYVFFSLYLDSLGYSKLMIGVLWAVSVVVEIIGFYSQSRWLHHFSLAGWVLLCSVVMVVRMGMTTWGADSLLWLVLAQSLHAVTFAVHHTVCIAWLSKHFPERLRGRGQALYSVIGYGLTGFLGATGGAALSARWGLEVVYAASVPIAVLAVACALGLRRSLHPNRGHA